MLQVCRKFGYMDVSAPSPPSTLFKIQKKRKRQGARAAQTPPGYGWATEGGVFVNTPRKRTNSDGKIDSTFF
jgi:hypothetical protein